MALGRSDSLPSSCCHIVFLEPPKPQPTRGNLPVPRRGHWGLGGSIVLASPTLIASWTNTAHWGEPSQAGKSSERLHSFLSFILPASTLVSGKISREISRAAEKNTSSGCVDGDPSTNMTAHHPELQLGNENFYRFSPFVAARVLIACQTIYRERNNPRPLLDQPHLKARLVC